MTKIIHVLDNFDIGGAQRMLMRFLESSDPEESSVVSMSRRGTVWEEQVEASPIPLQFLPTSRLLSARTWRSARSCLRSLPGDIVHVHMQYATIVFLPVAKGLRKKTVVTLHNVSDSVENRRQRVRSRLHRTIIRRFADKVISVGPLVTEAWSPYLPGHDIVTIQNTVPLPSRVADGVRGEVRRKIDGTPEDAVVVIAVASLLPKKDLATLVAAFAETARNREDARLWIVGTGMMRDALEAQIAEAGLSGKAMLLGARTDVQDLLGASDVFALSSKIEGLPISMLEAMAAGLPVVVPDVGDIRTVVGTDCGIVVPPGDSEALAAALNRVIDDPRLRQRLGEAGRAKVETDHSEEAWLKQMRDLYREL